MTKPIGFVLCAGFGTRLRPLTEFWAKPLIPFLGSTPLALALSRLYDIDIDEIWINTHYKHEQFLSYIKKLPFKINIHYEQEILGTGGAFNFLKHQLKGRDILVINGDVIADFDLLKLIDHHKSSSAIATMMLLDHAIPGETPVSCEANQIVAIQKDTVPGTTPRNFACAQIFGSDFLDLLPNHGSFDIIKYGYQKALNLGQKVSFVSHRGFWVDIGSVKKYYETIMNLSSTDSEQLKIIESLNINKSRLWLNKSPISIDQSISDSKIPANCTLTNSVVEEGVIIETGASLQNCVALPEAFISRNSCINNSICGGFGIINIS